MDRSDSHYPRGQSANSARFVQDGDYQYAAAAVQAQAAQAGYGQLQGGRVRQAHDVLMKSESRAAELVMRLQAMLGRLRAEDTVASTDGRSQEGAQPPLMVVLQRQAASVDHAIELVGEMEGFI